MAETSVEFDNADPDLKYEFQNACEKVKEIIGNLDSQQLLFFYGRYKQSTSGPCNTSKPSFFDFTGKQKWLAWKNLGDTTSEQAMTDYIEELTKIDPSWRTKLSKPSKQKKNFGPVQSVLLNTDAPLRDDEKTVFDYVKECDLEKLVESLKIVDVNQKDDDGMTLLHWASDRCYIEVLNLLIQNGANLNCQDAEGQTALHFAYSCDHQEVIDLLLSHGADASICDNEGNLPGKL